MTAEADSDPRRASAPRPPKPPKRSRIGDLSMRVVYRVLAVAVVLVVAAVAVVAALVLSGTSDRPGEVSSGQVAAPPAATPSPGSSPPSASPSVSPSASAVSASASASASASGSPEASASPSPSTLDGVARDRSAIVAALADSRVPDLPRDKKLARLYGKAHHKGKRVLKDRRSGVWFARLSKPWKIFGASPFSTKQVLPKVKGAPVRAMVVSCPVPIQAQRRAKDTALLAARWTLNHHPEDSRISWLASQPIKKGWLLTYKVKYKVKGKARFSVAAVAVTNGSASRPAMVFVTIPDVQRPYWRDVNTVVSSVKPK
ncbi:hypothetical protein [Streptosporangium saharense]|uniref:hypothetical protein n=1 Tax=Streptosporangium saharense TaxID=1706840 RepID=UPI0033318548